MAKETMAFISVAKECDFCKDLLNELERRLFEESPFSIHHKKEEDDKMKGIDVSYANGRVDWDAVAAAGYKFAICRCTYGRHGIDDTFIENVNGAHAAGLQVGAYHYSYALNVSQAIEEAEHCRKVIEDAGVLLELPVWFDMEDADGYKANNGFAFDPNEITAMCRAFLDNIQLNCGVYASYSWLTTYIDWQSLGCAVWNAEWGPGDDIKGMMWQYTDNQHIPGAGYFDANYIYES